MYLKSGISKRVDFRLFWNASDGTRNNKQITYSFTLVSGLSPGEILTMIERDIDEAASTSSTKFSPEIYASRRIGLQLEMSAGPTGNPLTNEGESQIRFPPRAQGKAQVPSLASAGGGARPPTQGFLASAGGGARPSLQGFLASAGGGARPTGSSSGGFSSGTTRERTHSRILVPFLHAVYRKIFDKWHPSFTQEYFDEWRRIEESMGANNYEPNKLVSFYANKLGQSERFRFSTDGYMQDTEQERLLNLDPNTPTTEIHGMYLELFANQYLLGRVQNRKDILKDLPSSGGSGGGGASGGGGGSGDGGGSGGGGALGSGGAGRSSAVYFDLSGLSQARASSSASDPYSSSFSQGSAASSQGSKRVLVMCQRKSGPVTDEHQLPVEESVRRIQSLVEAQPQLNGATIEYLSDEPTVDYQLKFSTDARTEQFIDRNLGAYSAIIFYTCPFLYFVRNEGIVHNFTRLLTRDGFLMVKGSSSSSTRNINALLYDDKENGILILNKYFQILANESGRTIVDLEGVPLLFQRP